MKNSGSGKVFLVGAGPGAVDLITMRGAEILSSAQAVIYDHLVNPGLLRLAPASHYAVAGRGVYLVLSGAGEADGQPLRKYSTIFLEADAHATLRASEITELLHYGLPDLSDMEVGYSGAAVQAAE